MKRIIVLMAFTICISSVLLLPVLTNAEESEEARTQLNRGISLLVKGRIDEAIDSFLKIIQKDPNYGLAYSNLGAAYYRKGELDKAVEMYKKAIEINPSDKTAHGNLGNIYADLKKYDEAIAEHRKVIELDPNNTDAFVDLGVALSQRGDLTEGINQFKKALSLNPYHPLARKNLGYAYYTMKKWPEAIDEFLIARDIDEWYPGVEEGLKVTLNKAFSDLKKWVRDKPTEPLSHYYLSYAHLYKGDVKKAMKEIEKAIELNRSKGEFYKAKAFFYINSDPFQKKHEDIIAVYKKHNDAIDAYKECITVDSSNWACYKSLGDSYLTIGELKEALNVIIKASNINPNIISVQAYLGVAYRKNGENEKAIAAFQKAVSLGARNHIIYSNLAATYIDLEKYDMAWRYARMAERMGFQGVSVLFKRLNQISKEPE